MDPQSPQTSAASIRQRANGRFPEQAEPPIVTSMLYGSYHVVCTWPPREGPVLYTPPEIRLIEPAMLESTLFGCGKCRKEVNEKLQPVKVILGPLSSVQSCEIVKSEEEVPAALARTTCECRTTPLSEKFAILPLKKEVLLYYQRFPGFKYANESDYSTLLLFNFIPTTSQIKEAVEGMEVSKKHGEITFKARD